MRNRVYNIGLFVLFLAISFHTNAQNIIIQSDETGSGSLIVDTFGVTYSADVQRYVHSNNWHIISSPVLGQQLGAFVSDNSIVLNATASDYDLAPYNENENIWTPYTLPENVTDFVVAKGYSTRRSATGNIVFSGTINAGEQNIAVTKDNFGWNAVGNSYTSAIAVNTTNGFIPENESLMDPSYVGLYIWDQAINDYSVIIKTDVLGSIAVGQGFIIKANAPGTIKFTRQMQFHSLEILTPFKSANTEPAVIKLIVNTGSLNNTTKLTFDNSSTTGLDPGYDVGKLKGNPKLALYSQLVEDNGVDFAIQSLPKANLNEYRIPVGLDFTTGGFVTFTSEYTNLPSNAKVILEDTKTNTFTRLDSKNAKYVTSIDQIASGFGRFYLHTSDALVTGVNATKESDFNVFITDYKIHIHGDTDGNTLFAVYSVDGKLWYQNKAKNQDFNTIDASSFTAGVYLLRIGKHGNTSVHKVVISGD